MRKRFVLLTVVALLAACKTKETLPDVPALLADLQSGDSAKSGRANLELIRIGEPAVPGLVQLLQSDDPRKRSLAASAFWGMGGKGRAAVPVLAEALADPDPAFRTSIAMALE